jgi:hypothetical protein
MFNKLKAKLGLMVHTGFEPKIIIKIGMNASEYYQALEEVREIAKILEIKNQDFLSQYPYNIIVK